MSMEELTVKAAEWEKVKKMLPVCRGLQINEFISMEWENKDLVAFG